MLFDVSRDEELVVEVAWVLVYVTSMSDVHSSQFIHAGLLSPVVARLALSRHLPLLTPVRFPNLCSFFSSPLTVSQKLLGLFLFFNYMLMFYHWLSCRYPDMDLWDECAKILRSIGNIVASDNSKCDAVLAAGQSLPGKPS